MATREEREAELAQLCSRVRELYGDDNPFDDDGNLIKPQYPVRIE